MKQFGILNTKLYKPDVRDDYIIREKVVEFLGQNRSKTLTLVVAPAGYGKSVTISQWLDISKAKHCWISIDEEFNEMRTFLSYLTYAVKSIIPDSLLDMVEIVKSSELPPDKVISNTLINELDEIKDELIVVLDDYYFIHNAQIHNILNELLRYPPKNFHLVIITRFDPSLNLSYIKAYGLFNEIRMSDLSLSKNEINSLAKYINGEEIAGKTADMLLEKTEGWIIGVRLALITMNQGKNIEKTLEEIKGDKHLLTEYLLSEVFLKEPEDARKLLLTASILDRFNEDLMKELVVDTSNMNISDLNLSVENLFDRFRKSTLFIITLDDTGEWFRYHHFFQNFLLNHLEKHYSKNQINELHRRAGKYFSDNKLFEEALQHALKSGDIELAVQIVEKNKYEFIETDQFGKLWKWLELLPEGTIEKNLSLLLARAFLRDTFKDFKNMKYDLLVAESLISKGKNNSAANKQLIAEFYCVCSNLNFNIGNIKEAYNYSVKGQELLSNKSDYLHDYGLGYQVFSLNSIGKFDEAIRILRKRFDEIPLSNQIKQSRNLAIQLMLYSFQGNLMAISKIAPRHYSLSQENKLWVTFAHSAYYLSESCYQWNQLDKAIKYSNALLGHYYSGRVYWVLHTLFVKAFAFLIKGENEDLYYTLSEIKEITDNSNNSITGNLTKAFEVEIALRQNDVARAFEYSKLTDFDCILPIVYFYFPQLTYIKLLIGLDEHASLIEAEEKLEKLIQMSRTSHRYNILTQALLMRSILFRKKNNKKDALKALKEAIKLAEPGGFIRIFVDLGEPMKELIDIAYSEEPDSSYISKLQQAFAEEESRKKKISLFKNNIPPSDLRGVDKLSDREVNLLKLVAGGYRNKEIAENLHLSHDSIKKYLYYIYQKLGVNNRVAAISKANELQILPKMQ